MLEFEVTLPPEAAGDLATRIMALWPGLEVGTDENRVCFALTIDDGLDGRLARLEETFQALEKARAIDELEIKSRNLGGPDSGPECLRVGRFLITSRELEAAVEPGTVVLHLETGCCFGTGGHPSTALALIALEEFLTPVPGAPSREHQRVLDVGAGSGILSLAAANLCQGPILAVDPSVDAVQTAAFNAGLNGLEDRITVENVGAEKAGGEYDLILANLVPSVLLRNGRRLAPLLAPGGGLIVAGFADAQAPQIVRAMTKAGLVTKKSYSQAGWSALTLVRAG